ncbi:MAG: RNA polymerase sigma factor [bacterium]|nr:RNA polymerase sigma factor [bacterium]
METGDEELMGAVAAGDCGALRALYDRYRARIMSYAFYALGDRGRAEDILQETFIRVFRHAGRFRPGERFSTWAYAIAANLCRDEMRRLRRRRGINAPVPPGPAGERRAPAAESPRRLAAAGEAADRLAAEIAALPGEQREVLALRFIEGMRYAEIAAALRIPIGTVQSRLHAGVRALRARLTEFR